MSILQRNRSNFYGKNENFNGYLLKDLIVYCTANDCVDWFVCDVASDFIQGKGGVNGIPYIPEGVFNVRDYFQIQL